MEIVWLLKKTLTLPKQSIFTGGWENELYTVCCLDEMQTFNRVKLYLELWICIRASPALAHYVTLQNYFSHPSLVTNSFPTPPIKLKLGLQVGGRLLVARLLVATHLDQSNHLGPVNKFDLIVSITLLQDSERCTNFPGFLVDSLDWTDEPDELRFPVNFHWSVTYWALVEMLYLQWFPTGQMKRKWLGTFVIMSVPCRGSSLFTATIFRASGWGDDASGRVTGGGKKRKKKRVGKWKIIDTLCWLW
jgi:hypothetical protein